MPPKKKAKLTPPRWEYLDDKVWTTYDDKDSALLEKAFADSKTKKFTTTKLTFNKGFKTKYEFDFTNMTQTNTDTAKVRSIRRVADNDADDTVVDKDVQWYWKDDSGLFVAFYDEDTEFIEKAFKKDPASLFKTTALSFNAEHLTPYIFDFSKMEQLNTESNTVRKLQRGKKAKAWDVKDYGVKSEATSSEVAKAIVAVDSLALNFPDYWTPKKSEVDLVDIDITSDEAKRILKPFKSTIKRSVTILSVKRIQNYALWPFYALTRKAIGDKYGGNPNEKMLFHGARVRANMDAITNFGFDMRVAANGLYGIGIYFAVNAVYSDHGYVLQNPDKTKEMFICRVTCGQHVPGHAALRRPPPKDDAVPNGELFDSVTDTGETSIMHVVFNNAQAYPEYVVKYK